MWALHTLTSKSVIHVATYFIIDKKAKNQHYINILANTFQKILLKKSKIQLPFCHKNRGVNNSFTLRIIGF